MKNLIIEKVTRTNATKSNEEIMSLIAKEYKKVGIKTGEKFEKKNTRKLIQYTKDQMK